MSSDEAEQIIEKLVLYEADSENYSAPSDFELGRAIRVLGFPEAFNHFENAIDRLEVSEDEDDED